jgi:peptide/nickel transport system substrate-binding protein
MLPFRDLMRCKWTRAALAAAAVLLAASPPAQAVPAHGIAMHGEPALTADFAHLPYVNPDAPQGGQLRLGSPGSFDNLNPFTIKGNTPQGLREYVFESLMARSADEPFTLYGLIAGGIETPADRSSVTFHLRPQARFSDGQPVTVEDVLFSHSALAEKGWPFHRLHYGKVAKAEAVGPRAVRFTFKVSGDRELPLILGLMPIIPRHKVTIETIDRTTLEPVTGSGPYVIAKVDAGRSITYRKNPYYWGRNLPLQRGRYNFGEISFEFFRDQSAMFEAFKAGALDARVEDDPARWAEGYGFRAMLEGRAMRREIATGLPAGMAAIVLNTRRAPFEDLGVRRALIELLDAEWINRSLYHGLYRRSTSYFARSELASSGRPADARERALLAPFPTAVRADILEGRSHLPVSDGSGNNREALKRAHRLLAQAGFALAGGRMVHQRTGRPLAFEFLASSRTQERLVLSYAENLKRLGITLRLRQVDSAQYSSRLKSFDFDMAQVLWPASLSPGNEQFNRWSAAAAKAEGSFNYAGVHSPAADAMIGALLVASRREDFVSAVRALDRVLLSGDYVVPLFHAPGQWLAWHTRIAFPDKPPLTGIAFDTWWSAQ